MPLVNVGSVELDYERGGSGPPLLLIMGMSGTALHWGEPFLSSLRQDFDTIVYDHRGVGASSRVEEPFTILELAEDAAGLLDALEVGSAHVMGVSMGGMVAQELALAHPSGIRTLVLGCTYCGGIDALPARQATMQRLAEARASGDRARALRTGWEVNVSPRFVENADAGARFLEIGRRRRVAIPVVMEQLGAIAGHDTSERLPGLKVPTLVVHGTADEVVPVENAHIIASLIPGSRLEILDGVGHLFFWEEPQRSAELVREHASVNAAQSTLSLPMRPT